MRHFADDAVEMMMAGQPGVLDLSGRYEALSAAGDPLERLSAVAGGCGLRGFSWAAGCTLRRSVRGKGGRPRSDPLLMFKRTHPIAAAVQM